MRTYPIDYYSEDKFWNLKLQLYFQKFYNPQKGLMYVIESVLSKIDLNWWI